MADLSLIPKSRAKTAYGLLSEIVAIVKDEPKRLDMIMPLNLHATESYPLAPSCGTVGCVAGWAVMLRGDPRSESTSITSQGVRILGVQEALGELFYKFPKTPRDDAKPKTIARHAAEEITIIRAFQKKYRTQLLAKKLG